MRWSVLSLVVLALLTLPTGAEARRKRSKKKPKPAARNVELSIADLQKTAERHFRNGQHDTAAAFFVVIYELDNDRDAALVNAALSFRRAGKLEDAEPLYRRAYKADNQNADALFGLAETLRLQGKDDDARKLFVKYLSTERRDTKIAKKLVEFAQEKIKDLDPKKRKQKRRAMEKRTDDGVNTAFHKAHKGEIVFSTRPLSAKSSDKQTETTFRLDAPIHYVALLKESMGNAFRETGVECSIDESAAGDLVYRMTLDGKSVSGKRPLHTESATVDLFEQWTAFRVNESLTQQNLAEPSYPALSKAFSTRILKRLRPGNNVIQMTLSARCRGRSANGNWTPQEIVVARGAFTVQVKKGDVKRAIGVMGPVLPTPAKVSRPVRDALMTAMKARHEKGGDSVLAIIPSSSKAEDVRNDSGRLIMRRRHALVVMKTGKRRCAVWDTTFAESTERNGDTRVEEVADKELFHCENAPR